MQPPDRALALELSHRVKWDEAIRVRLRRGEIEARVDRLEAIGRERPDPREVVAQPSAPFAIASPAARTST